MIADAPRSVGVAVTDMERVIFLLPTTPRSEPVAVIRTLRAYDREAVQAAVAGPEGKAEKYKGYTLHEAKDRHGMCLCAIDGQTFAVGRSRGVKDVLDRVDGRSTPRPHGTALEWAAEKHQITLGMAPEAFVGLWLFEGRAEVKTVGKAAASSSAESRPATIQEKTRPPERFEKQRPPENKKPNPPDSIKEKQGRGPGSAETFVSYQPPDRFEDRREEPDFGEILANLPVQALPYKPLLSARSLAATIDLGAESKARWRITFEDEDAAKDGEASVRIALYVLREALGRLPRELHVSESCAQADRGGARRTDGFASGTATAKWCDRGGQPHAGDGRGGAEALVRRDRESSESYRRGKPLETGRDRHAQLPGCDRSLSQCRDHRPEG